MKKVLFLILFILPLAGCVPAVLVAGATAAGATLGGAVIYDQRSYQTMNQDHNARSLAQYRLSNDFLLKGKSHISISVFNNIALLIGQVQTPEMRSRAYQIVSKIPNIRRIYNEISINTSTSVVQQASDSWITIKVRTLMLGKSGLHSSNLKVITQNNIVYLMGIVTPKQAAIAANVARRITGVIKVIKVFEYE